MARPGSSNNATDFLFGDTTGAITAAGQRLGAPGPENLGASVFQTPRIPQSLVDPFVPAGLSPNRLRDTTPDPANNATFGTMTITRKFTNNTGAAVTRLRFRIVDMTASPTTGALADLRAMSSTDINLPVTGVGMVTVRGTTLEMQGMQPMGGAINSSMSADIVTLGTPLPNGGTINLQFKVGVQRSGTFKFWINVEALP